MKKLINDLIKIYKRIKISKVARLGKNVLLSRHSFVFNDSKNKENIFIHNNVMMCGKLYSQNNGKIVIDSFSSIRNYSMIWCVNKVYIGKYVIISDHVIITDNNNHPVDPIDRKQMIKNGWSTELWKWHNSESSPVYIEDNVWIGKDSKILKGVRIGENSIVAMGSVVTKNVPKNVIVAGNPAKIVKKLILKKIKHG